MESAFQIMGYFEEIWDATPGRSLKCYGTRPIDKQPNREYGMAGEQFFTITQPLSIDRGHKKAVIRASEKRPQALMSRYQPICGRMIKDRH